MNIKYCKQRAHIKRQSVVRPSSHIEFKANDGSEIESKKKVVTATCCSRALCGDNPYVKGIPKRVVNNHEPIVY